MSKGPGKPPPIPTDRTSNDAPPDGQATTSLSLTELRVLAREGEVDAFDVDDLDLEIATAVETNEIEIDDLDGASEDATSIFSTIDVIDDLDTTPLPNDTVVSTAPSRPAAAPTSRPRGSVRTRKPTPASLPRVSSTLFRFSSDLEQRLQTRGLSGPPLRLAVELVGELETADERQRALWCHAIAEAARTADTEAAREFAIELDRMATELDPIVLPAHQALVADHWRAGDWTACAERLGLFATQLEELVGGQGDRAMQARLRGCLPGLYVQLELLLEARVGQEQASLQALAQHALELGERQQLLPALNAARMALHAGDTSAVVAAWERLVEESPPGLREAFVIDLVTWLWRDRGDVRHAVHAVNLVDNTEFSNPVHLAVLQLLAWEGRAGELEAEVLARWLDHLDDALERLGRTDVPRRTALTQRIAALHHRLAQLLASRPQDAELAATHFDRALALEPRSPWFNDHAVRIADRGGDLETADAALVRQIEISEHPTRRALLHLRRAWRARLALGEVDDVAALDPIVDELERATAAEPGLTAANLALQRLLLRTGRLEAYVELEQRLEAADPTVSDETAAIAHAERLETLLRAPQAFDAWLALGPELAADNRFVMRALERTGLLAGRYDTLAELYADVAARQTDPERQRALLWKHVQLVARVVGEEDAGIEAYKRYLELAPDDVATLDALAHALIERDAFAQAVDVLGRLLPLVDNPTERRYLLETRADLLEEAGCDAETLQQALAPLRELEPENRVAELLTRRSLIERSDWTGLERWCERQVERGGTGSASARVRQLEAAFVATTQSHAPHAGRRHLERLRQNEPDWAPALDLHEEFLLATGAWAELVDLLEHRAGVSPPGAERAMLLEQAGSLCVDRLDDVERGHGLYQQCLIERDDDDVCWRALLDTAWAERRFDELVHFIQARLEHGVELVQHKVHLRELAFAALIAADQAEPSDRTEALELARQSLDPLVTAGEDLFAVRLQQRLERGGRNPEAELALLETFANQIETDPAELLHIELQRWRLGIASGQGMSLEQLAALVDLAPEHPVVAIALDTWVHARPTDGRRSPEEVSALIELLGRRPTADHPVEEALRLEQMAMLSLEMEDAAQARSALSAVVGLCPEHLPARLAMVAIDDALDDLVEAAQGLEAVAARLAPGAHRELVLHAAIQRWRAGGEPRRADALQTELDPTHAPAPGVSFDPADPASLERLFRDELDCGSRAGRHRPGVDSDPPGHETRQGILHLTLARAREQNLGIVGEAWPHWRQAARHLGQVRTVRLALVRYAPHVERNHEGLRTALLDTLASLLEDDELGEVMRAEARRLASQGQVARAQQLLERVLTWCPDSRDALDLQIALALDAGDIELATRSLSARATLTAHRGLRSALELEAALLLDTLAEDRDGALEHLRRALAATPDDVTVLYFLGRLYEAHGAWAAAARARLSESRLHGPRAREACVYNAARLLGRRQGNHHGAAAALDRLADRPSLRLRVLHRELCISIGELDEVVGRRLRDAARSPTQRARYAWLLGLSHADAETAMRLMAEALEDDPDYVPAALTLELLAREHERLELLAISLASLARTAEEPLLLVEAGRLLERTGNFEAAERLFERAAEQCPIDRFFGPYGPGEVMRRSFARRELAAQEVEHLVDLMQRDVAPSRKLRLQNRAADLLMREDRLDEAADAWRAVIALDPHDGYAHATLSLLLDARDQVDDLVVLRQQQIELAERVDPELTCLLRWELGEILARRSGQPEEGMAVLAGAIEAAPGYRPLWDSLVRLLAQVGDHIGLIELLERDLGEASPERQGPLACEIGQLLELVGRPDEALQACVATLHYLDVGDLHLAALDTIERITRQLDQPEQHLTALQELAEREPDPAFRALSLMRLGEAYEHQGHLAPALDAYQRALELAPERAWIADAWQRCCVMVGELDVYDAWLTAAIDADAHSPRMVEFLAQRAFVAPDEARRDAALTRLFEREPDNLLGVLTRLRRAAVARDFSALADACGELAQSTWDAAARHALLEAALAFASVLDEPLPEAAQWELVEGDPDNRCALLRMLGQLQPPSAPVVAARLAGALALVAGGVREEALQLTTMGMWLMLAGDLEQSRHSLDEALRRESDLVSALKLRRYLAESANDAPTIAALALRESELLTRQEEVHKRIMQAATLHRDHLDKPAEAIRLLRSLLERAPLHEGAFALLDRIYTERNMRSELHDLVVARAKAVGDISAQKQLLARAAEIAQAAGSVQDAIENWRQVVARDPDDLDSYRGMIAFCLDNERWEEAVEALHELTQRSRDQAEISACWETLGELLAERLGRYRDAIPVYRQLERVRGGDLFVRTRLADLYELTEQFDQALEMLTRIVPFQPDVDSRKAVLERIFDGQLEWFGATAKAEQTMLEMRALDPSDLALLARLVDWLRLKGLQRQRDQLLTSSFDFYRARYLNGEGRVPLRAMLAAAEWMGDRDRSFVVGSLLVASGEATAEETRTVERMARQAPRRPRTVPLDELEPAQTMTLSGALLELMRQAERFLSRSGPHMAQAKALSRKNRVKPGSRAELSALEPHVQAFPGVEMPTVYLVPEPAPLPTLAMLREPVLVLTEAELDARKLAETRFRVAAGAAALALGCAHFATASFDQFCDLLLGLARAVLPNQTLSVTPRDPELVESIAKSVPKKARDGMSAPLLQLARTIGDDTIGAEYQALQLTCLRYGLVTMRDPAPAIDVVVELEQTGQLPVGGTMREVLRFAVSEDYFALRRTSGIAME